MYSNLDESIIAVTVGGVENHVEPGNQRLLEEMRPILSQLDTLSEY